MNTIQTEAKTLKINTTLFDMLAAMQEASIEADVDVYTTDAQIVSTVAKWMQSGRITSYPLNPIRSAA